MASNTIQIPTDLLHGDPEAFRQLLALFSSANLTSAASAPPTNGQAKGEGKQRGKARGNKQSNDEDEDEDEDEEGEEEDAVDTTPPGMLGECKPLYQIHDKNGQSQWVVDEPNDILEPAEGKATQKFAFLIRKVKSDDSRKKYDISSIIVQSPLLKELLGIALRDYPGVTTSLQRLVFSSPFAPFVHRWPQLVKLLDPAVTPDETARQHLQLFHDTLYEELKLPISAKLDLVKNGVITFEHLWTILEPGLLIFGFEDGKERIWELTNSRLTSIEGVPCQYLNVWSVDQDADKFGRSNSAFPIFEFGGTARITSLRAFPLDFHPKKQQVMKRLEERGRLFESLAGYHFMHYIGTALTRGRCGFVKVNLDSRVILDTEAHNKFLPNQAVRLSNLENPKQSGSNVVSAEEDDDEYDDSYSEVSADDCLPTPDTDNSSSAKPKRRPLTEKELLLAVPFVRGYAMKAKTWFRLFVDQVTDIQFNENAFESLVLDDGHKKLIKACVETQRKYKNTFDDIISGKGRGMIMLLAGRPGVGKTLTAESVAENMKVPLYMMSAGDLGLDPSGIEDALNTVMDMVAKWNAVLLLDEADVFLEARSTHDLERNKLVSIFLRVLEYYEGILFLTTNRIKNIDDAFHSRIHLTINYPDLSAESRQHIWRTFLGAKTVVKPKDLERLASIDLNGRQIKNVIKTAQMLARSEWDAKDSAVIKVELKHIETVLAVENAKIEE